MKKLTQKQATDIAKALVMINKAYDLLEGVRAKNDSFRYGSNTIALFNQIDGVQNKLEGIVTHENL